MNIDRFCERIQSRISRHIAVPFELDFWTGQVRRFGENDPAFQIKINNRRGLAALASLDELAITCLPRRFA